VWSVRGHTHNLAYAEAVVAEYVWQHDLRGESDRLRLMSDLLWDYGILEIADELCADASLL
jgi:hypothetical protein